MKRERGKEAGVGYGDQEREVGEGGGGGVVVWAQKERGSEVAA